MIIVTSSLFGIIIFEFIFLLFTFSTIPDGNKERRIFWQSNNGIFKNIDDIFTYLPNNEFLVTGYYFDNKRIYKEFEYKNKTNNFGLIQNDNLIPNKKSLIFLGDSFMEGFGDSTWFNTLSKNIKNRIGTDVQIINGGLLGTGFIQFNKLLTLLEKRKIIINNIFIVFISDDIRRSVFNFDESLINCMDGLSDCDLNIHFIKVKTKNEIDKNLNFLLKKAKKRS